MSKALFTTEELAERWYLQPVTLDRWRWAGKGPRHIIIGRKAFYRIQDIEAFEERKAKKSTSFVDVEDISQNILKYELLKQRKKNDSKMIKKHL